MNLVTVNEILDFFLNALRKLGISNYGNYAIEIARILDTEIRKGSPESVIAQKMVSVPRTELIGNHTKDVEKALKILAKRYATGFIIDDPQADVSKAPLVSSILIDQIDSFSKVAQISQCQVQDSLPLDWKEQKIKQMIYEILEDPYYFKDWGGEVSDILSTRVNLNGTRIVSAFLLKGRGTKGPLTPQKCGKNGDQIVRLFREPATLYCIQHVDTIESSVLDIAEAQALKRALSISSTVYVCIIDGLDTARLAAAYGYLHLNGITNSKKMES